MHTEPNPHTHTSSHGIHMPAPTAWPFTLALGITFLFMGIMTYWLVSVLGAVLMIFGSVGWFRNVLPEEQELEYAVTTEVFEVKTDRIGVARLPISPRHRKFLPIERYTPVAGVLGGIAGGIAMVIPAVIYGYVYQHSIWYAPNLLAAMALPNWADQSTQFLTSFHLGGFLVAIGVHAFASILMGIVYGSVLPMSPRWPILKAGFLAPLVWTGLLTIGLVALSPALLDRINWLWFILSQIAFGLVAGFVVNLHVPVRTPQFRALTFSERAGVITRGLIQEAHDMETQRKLQDEHNEEGHNKDVSE